jgi:hypothetical protein
MKITHRVPVDLISDNMTGKLDPDYERQVNRSTRKLEVQYARAQRRVEAVEKRALKAQVRSETLKAKKERDKAKKEYKDLILELEARRLELMELERMMTYSPAGSQNRGKESFKPVPSKVQGLH